MGLVGSWGHDTWLAESYHTNTHHEPWLASIASCWLAGVEGRYACCGQCLQMGTSSSLIISDLLPTCRAVPTSFLFSRHMHAHGKFLRKLRSHLDMDINEKCKKKKNNSFCARAHARQLFSVASLHDPHSLRLRLRLAMICLDHACLYNVALDSTCSGRI